MCVTLRKKSQKCMYKVGCMGVCPCPFSFAFVCLRQRVRSFFFIHVRARLCAVSG